MNILYIDHYAGSLRDGMEFRPYYLAREWQKTGHKVTVIGGDYSHLRNHQPTVEKDLCSEMIDGIEYRWIKSGQYQGNGAKRAFSIFRFVGKLWLYAGRLAREFQPDVVISSSTYPLDSVAAYRIAKKAKARYIHEAHDIWPLTLIELGGMSPYHPFVLLLNWAERYAYRHCAKCVSILPAALPHMVEQGLNPAKFVHIPNGIVPEDWENTEPLNDEHRQILDRLRSEGRFIILYVGGHAISNALDHLLDAADRMRDRQDIRFVLIGDGAEKERLVENAEKLKLDNVIFLPRIPKQQIPNALAYADALFICAEPSPLYRYGVSMNKVYDYMMAAKPILYGVKAANNDVETAGCGLFFDSDKPKELAESIRKLRDMTAEERSRMGENGRQWVTENCEYGKLAKRFEELMK